MISLARASIALFAMVLAMAGLGLTAAAADLGPSPGARKPPFEMDADVSALWMGHLAGRHRNREGADGRCRVSVRPSS